LDLRPSARCCRRSKGESPALDLDVFLPHEKRRGIGPKVGPLKKLARIEALDIKRLEGRIPVAPIIGIQFSKNCGFFG
jgi:hypothetical protein